MSSKVRKILSILIIIIVVAGWYVTVFGAGSINSVKDLLKFGLDINGGVYVVMEGKTEGLGYSSEEINEIMDQTRAVLNNRVNQLGVAESTVTREGTNRLRVEMPGVTDAEEAINAIGTTAQLSFVLSVQGLSVFIRTDSDESSIQTEQQYQDH